MANFSSAMQRKMMDAKEIFRSIYVPTLVLAHVLFFTASILSPLAIIIFLWGFSPKLSEIENHITYAVIMLAGSLLTFISSYSLVKSMSGRSHIKQKRLMSGFKITINIYKIFGVSRFRLLVLAYAFFLLVMYVYVLYFYDVNLGIQFSFPRDLRSIIVSLYSVVLGFIISIMCYKAIYGMVYANLRSVNKFTYLFLGSNLFVILGAVDRPLPYQLFSAKDMIISFLLSYAFLIKDQICVSSTYAITPAYVEISHTSNRNYPKRRYLLECIRSSLKRDYIYLSFVLLKLHILIKRIRRKDTRSDKRVMKMAANIYYSMKDFDTVIKISQEANSTLEKKGLGLSETLFSFEALSMTHLGKSEQAELMLKNSLKASPENLHYLYSLAYIYWYKGDINSSLELLRHTRQLLPKDQAIWIDAFEAQILCEQILAFYPSNHIEVPNLIYSARNLIDLAIDFKNSEKKYNLFELENQINYTNGFVLLLEKRYEEAMKHLSQSIWESSHLAARLHLAMLHIVWTQDYETALSHLVDTLRIFDLKISKYYCNSNSTEWPYVFRHILEWNIKRVQQAINKNIIFRENIIYYQYNTKELFPKFSTIEVPEHQDRKSNIRMVTPSFRSSKELTKFKVKDPLAS